MKYFKILFLLMIMIIIAGSVISPKFCEKHHKDDYCWTEGVNPNGGTSPMPN